VITGLGVITSLGETVSEFWRRLLAGESGIGPIRQFDATKYESRIAGEVVAFDPAKYIDGREIKRIDRFAQFALAAAGQAVAESGLDFTTGDPYRTGVIIGSGIGGLHEIETQFERLLEKGPDRVSAFFVPKLMLNAAAGLVSIRWGLKGPNWGLAAACASGTNAVGEAFEVIRRGEADVMLAGGSEASVTRLGIAGFCAMKALSTRNDEPQRASRPFDRDRDGFVMGEGAGILVLEEFEQARARGAKIYAEVAGYGMSADGSHITAPDVDGAGAAHAMQDALRDARLGVEAVDYINAHGTSTSLGDAAEVKAVKTVFGPQATKLAMSSTKSAIGHLLGGSGAVELVATLMCMKDQVAHATLNLEHPDEGFDLNFVPNVPQQRKIDVALSNSFGFGGHNACLLVRRV
jgi:3-oxoacyl-[acyl-carrier-protein] synthase II